jgi:tRNA 2-selenouridine synthase
VHPHQIEVQDFGSYALIADLRPAPDFALDHVPGAVNLPWARTSAPHPSPPPGSDAGIDDDPAARLMPGDRAVSPAAVPAGVEEPIDGLPYGLHVQLARLAPGDAVLLYDGRGGLDSHEAATRLRAQGIDTDVLPGGYASYRRWVAASVDLLARALDFVWVRSAPGGAAQAVVSAVAAQGVQVLPLASLLGQRLLPGLSLLGEPGTSPGMSLGLTPGLSQAAFESALVDVLRRLDPGRPVWVDECLWVAESVSLPRPLGDRWQQSPAVRVELAWDRRPAVIDALGRTGEDAALAWVDALPDALMLGHADVIARARALAAQARGAEAVSLLVAELVDPLYADLAAPSRQMQEAGLRPTSSDPADVWSALQRLPDPWPGRLRPDPDQISP